MGGHCSSGGPARRRTTEGRLALSQPRRPVNKADGVHPHLYGPEPDGPDLVSIGARQLFDISPFHLHYNHKVQSTLANGTPIGKGSPMQLQTLPNVHVPTVLVRDDHAAITKQMNELKEVGPEWDGPGSITPTPVLIDLVATWLIGHWRADLGTPDICPTSEGGVCISWDWDTLEHSIDVRADGAVMEWCQYNPRTLQTVESNLPMNQQGWDAILAGLE